MTALPASSDFTGSAVTEGGFKTAITGQRDFLAGLLGTAGTKATALATLGALIGSTAAKTAAYTVTTSDRGKLIDATGTWTLLLTSAAAMGDGFAFAVRNSGTGTITIDPSSTEQIDGASTIALAAGESCLVVCNGTAWRTVGRTAAELPAQSGHAGKFLTTDGSAASWANAGEWEFISAQEPTTDVASIVFTGLSGYRHLKAVILSQATAIGALSVDARASGGTWRSGLIVSASAPGAVTAVMGACEIAESNNSGRPKLVHGSINFAGVGTALDRSSALGNTSGNYLLGYCTHAEIWDELRFSLANFEGSTADQRSYIALYGIRG